MTDKKILCSNIKNEIKLLNINELEEIFKIIYKNNESYNKNATGININLFSLNNETLELINNYINFCVKSHNEISKYENMCNLFSNSINKINKNTEKELNEKNININNDIKNKQKISSYMKFYLLKKKYMKQSVAIPIKYDKYLTHEEYIL